MSATAVLVAGVAVVLLLPLAWRVVQRRFDPFEPILIFALAWGVMFVVRPAAILIRDDTNFYGVDIGSTLDKAVLLALLGAVAFVVGYEVSIGRRLARRLRPPPETFDSSAALLGAYAVAAAGMVALVSFLLSAGGVEAVETFFRGRSDELNELVGESTTYLWWASLAVVPAALVTFAVAVVDRRPATFTGAALLIAIALVRTVPVGNRVFLLVLLGGIAVFVYLYRQTRPGIVVLIVAPVLALLVSTAILDFRYRESREDLWTIAERLATTPSRLVGPVVKGADSEMAPALAGALRVVPERLSYRYGGATFGDLIRRPIPRQIWEGKPDTPGHQVVVAVWPEPRKLGGFDPTFTPLLDFYWDFGLLGVFLGMAVYGAVARALYEYMRLNDRNVVAQLLFASALWYLVAALRQDPVSFVIEGFVLFAPLIGIFLIAAAREPEAREPQAA